jgi:hypothetical protein
LETPIVFTIFINNQNFNIMKFNKLFFAAVSFAALAMVGCKSKNDPENSGNGSSTTPPPPATETTEDAPEVISLDAPAAGKTTIAIYAEVCPNGAYLVGNFNDYNVGDDQTASFEAVQGQKNWYAVTIDYRDDLQAKAIARPSDPDVALGWSFQWGKNYDPADPGDVKEGTKNTRIIGGDGEFVYENNGQPKISAVKDGGVVYIWVKEWAASPVIEAKKLETAWAKSRWSADSDEWTWKQMEAKGNGRFELPVRWVGAGGINIAETEGGTDQWYPTDKIEMNGVKSGDSILIVFESEKMTIGKVSFQVLEGTPDVPAGEGTFVVSIRNKEYTEGDKCIFTGNFEENSWGDSDREMTYNAEAGTWSWTGAYPVNFEYKVIYNGAWAAGDNVVFDGTNFEAEFDIQ